MSAEPFVSLAVRHRLGALALDAAFEVKAPWTVLFGPSGSGKSTILRSIAGLVRPDAGTIRVLGTAVFAPGVWLPAHRRAVRWAGQRAALFPHRSVRWNLAAGAHGVALEPAMRRFGLEALAEKMPGELSGGQQQLVAVVRAAMSAQGKVLLLDEPFAGLDSGLRTSLIAGLKEWVGDWPVISVTHDVGEAFQLGADVVRVSQGRVVAQGPVAEVLAAERAELREVLG
jgi:molybdate transport system ATP-binding protein